MTNDAPDADRPIRVLIVDDHELLRDGVTHSVDVQSDMVAVGQAANGAEAIEAFRQLQPDVTLMDLQMPGMTGLDALVAIRGEFPEARIIVLTTFSGDAQIMRALQAGAYGYILKSTMRRELGDAIRAVHQGRRALHPEAAHVIALSATQETLNEREIEVLALAARGSSNKLIARELGISDDAVKARLRSIFEKLDVSDRTHAVTVAIKRGIIEI